MRIAWVCALFVAVSSAVAAEARFEPVGKHGSIEVFLWRDVCNVYVLRSGEAAMMIDIGDGSALEHLSQIGVRRLEWVLLTHHHREQVQGHRKLAAWKPQVAGPEAERGLLEKPGDFRKTKPSLGDRYSVHGASYVRPPVEPLKLDRGFRTRDTFTWQGQEFWCLETAGNSPGHMSYFLKTDRGWLAFSGDVMLAGGRMHNWFDTEWDYGFARGLYALIGSVSLLESFEPAMLLPSHGPVIGAPKDELRAYQQKLRKLARLYVRGYTIGSFEAADTDNASRPSAIPHLWQTTRHLYKFRGPNHGPNFTILLADSGRALVVDCGLGKNELDALVEQMRQRLGLKGIDMVLVTHMHGDHNVETPYVRQKYGATIATLDRVAEVCEQPHRFEYAAMPWAYSPSVNAILYDRKFKAGEKFTWEGYEFTVDWMPGQTEFGCCIHAMIDGKRVAFTGDNLFANPEQPDQTGHEAVVARNSAILEEGYIYGAEYLRKLQPDLIMGGHSFVMDRPKELIERFCNWSVAMRDAFGQVSNEEDYRYMFDPYWVRADPYRLTLTAGGTGEMTLAVRNFLSRPRRYGLALHGPEGIVGQPGKTEVTVQGESTARIPIQVKAGTATKPGTYFVALDATVDGNRYGEWFDFIVIVRPQ